MPAERLSMRKVREVLRLRHTLGMSLRQISEATGVGETVVGEYVRRAGVIGISWPVPEAIDDAELERRLFPVPCETGPPRAAIDWRKIHEEMKRRSVTLVLLWEEYRAEQAAGYGYSRFCDLYGEWRKTISATMRQTHPAGERLFVDYAGDTVPVLDQITNAQRPAHIFVAALGASNYTYAEARWYRRSYRKAFPDEAIDGKVLSHALNRRMAALMGFAYMRITPNSPGCNSSSSFSEQWGVTLHATPEQVAANRRRGASIHYADLAALMVMLDIKPGGGVMDAVNEAQALVLPRTLR